MHAFRPRVCRSYDCRSDERIWLDYEKRIPAPIENATLQPELPPESEFDLVERAKARAAAHAAERTSMAAPWVDPKA